MPTAVVCKCGKQYRVKDGFSGKLGRCPACGNEVRIAERKPLADSMHAVAADMEGPFMDSATATETAKASESCAISIPQSVRGAAELCVNTPDASEARTVVSNDASPTVKRIGSLKAAKKTYPAVRSSYKPSGKTTASALLAMIIAAPVIITLLLVVSLLIFGVDLRLASKTLSDPSIYGLHGELIQKIPRGLGSRLVGALAILSNLGIMFLIIFIPAFPYVVLGRIFKNRSRALPVAAAGVTSFIVAVVLYWPVWQGESLAVTDLSVYDFDIKPIIVALCGVGAPLLSMYCAFLAVSEDDKYCEKAGVFLDAVLRTTCHLNQVGVVLSLLSGRQYAAVAPLCKPPQKDENRAAELVLWWHPNAQTAYIELSLCFCEEISKNKTEKHTWLVFSRMIDSTEAAMAKTALAHN